MALLLSTDADSYIDILSLLAESTSMNPKSIYSRTMPQLLRKLKQFPISLVVTLIKPQHEMPYAPIDFEVKLCL